MRRDLHNAAVRPAATVPLFALLLVPLMGMLAFSIDLGYIALVRTDLQTAADAAALAGAEKLQNLFVQYTSAGMTGSQISQASVLTSVTTNTHTSDNPMYTAEQFASYNKAGNVSIIVRDQDVSFGFTDAQVVYHSDYSNYNSGFPNSVTVITRRDSTKNTPLSLFFGPIFGVTSKELNAMAAATIYSGDVTSLQVIQGVTGVGAHILPVALDVNIWNYFNSSNGKSPDGTVHLAPNGLPQLFIYPLGPWALNATNTPGSFGLIDVGPPQNNVPAFRSWIDNGQTPNDIYYLLSNSLLPVSLPSGPDGPKNWKVGPGLKSTLQSNFYDQMGVPNLIPLFIPASAPAGWLSQSTGSYVAGSGNGQNATYAVVGFAGVAISQADGSGSNMNISIQPSAVVDPTAYIRNPRPVGTQTSQFGATINNPVITTFISAKLTR
jgi:Flp pilus assembly protein TadG